MLTPQILKKLQAEQRKLDDVIRENYQKRNNVDDFDKKPSFIRLKIALFVEIGELANELKTFKHWKSQKEVNWDKAQEELIDCLHFYLSWANRFGIDFADYQFKKLVSEADYNELLLTLFSETETFATSTPWSMIKPKLLADNEKQWEDLINEAKTEKEIESLRAAKEEQKKNIEQHMSNSFLEAIKEDKAKVSFYRWLMIFEELAQKIGLKSEKDIEAAYLAKNKINWERQRKNY